MTVSLLCALDPHMQMLPCPNPSKFALPACHRCHVSNHVHEVHKCRTELHIPGFVPARSSLPSFKVPGSASL